MCLADNLQDATDCGGLSLSMSFTKCKGSQSLTCGPTLTKIHKERQEIVTELDKLLDLNANHSQNLEAIGELQSELQSLDAKKERYFLYLKSSWDILEKEKSRREFIKLESL